METTERAKFLVELLGEIDLMDCEAFPPNQAVAANEKPVGTATLYERKVYALSAMYRREHGLLVVEDAFARHDKNGHSDHHPRLERLREMAEVITQLFWLIVQERLGLHGDGKAHGLRDDWQIVQFDQQAQVPPFLRHLFGGGQ